MAKKMGRPPIHIDQTNFEKLCALGCALLEFECFFGCSDEHIEKWCKKTYGKTFLEIFRLKRGSGDTSLRKAQWTSAMNGSVPMQIFLGKQRLGQKDKTEITGQQSYIVKKEDQDL